MEKATVIDGKKIPVNDRSPGFSYELDLFIF